MLSALCALGLALAPAAPAAPSASDSYAQAAALFAEARLPQALAADQAALAADPELAQAHALRARLLREADEPPEMRRECAQTIALLEGARRTLTPEEQVAYATALELEGRPEKALSYLNTALQLSADPAAALEERARVWRLQGQNERAVHDLDAALAHGQRALYLYERAAALSALGRGDAALADLTLALRRNRRFSKAFALAGALLAARGDSTRALAAFQKALGIDPQDAIALIGRAQIRLGQRLPNLAFDDFDEAVRLRPNEFEPSLRRAEARWSLGQRDAALADWREAAAAPDLDAEHAVFIAGRLAKLSLWREAEALDTRAYDLARGDYGAAAAAVSDSPLRRPEESGVPLPAVPPPPASGALSETAVAALVGRAAAREALGQDQAALADLTQAVDGLPSSAAAWAARGEFRLRRGETAQALADLDQAVRLKPKDAAILVARARCHARQDRPSLARQDLDAALSDDPASAEAHHERGVLLERFFGDDKAAFADVQRAATLEPDNADYLLDLALLTLKQSRFSEAIELLDKIAKLPGAEVRALAQRADARSRLGDVQGALEDVQSGAERAGGYAGLYDVLGETRLRSLDDEQAVDDLDEALRLAPSLVPALVHRARAHAALGELSAALRDLQRAVALDELSPEAWTLLCRVQSARGEGDDAVKSCSRAVTVDVGFAPGYFYRALAELPLRRPERVVEDVDKASQLGLRRAEGLLAKSVAEAALRRYPEAHRDFERASALEPAARSPQVPLGLPKATDEGYFDALEGLESVFQSDPGDPNVELLRGDALLAVQRYDKAAAEYSKAAAAAPRDAEPLLARAVARMDAGDLAGAGDDLARAARLSPKDARVHVQLSILQALERRYSRALAEAQKAVLLDPSSAEAYVRAGNAHSFLKDYAAALKDYEQAVQADPGDADAYDGVGLAHFSMGDYDRAVEAFSRAIALDPVSDRFRRNRAAAYADQSSFWNAAVDYRAASLLNTDPGLVEDYRKLLEGAKSQLEGGDGSSS